MQVIPVSEMFRIADIEAEPTCGGATHLNVARSLLGMVPMEGAGRWLRTRKRQRRVLERALEY